MEIKHKECFIPNIIKYWDLQPVSKYARAAAEFVNLYSKWRGINRFPALLMVFDLLDEWDKVQERGFTSPDVASLRKWVATESKLGNPVLETYCKAHPDDAVMVKALEWSKAVNATVADIVKGGLPPFPYVRECLEKAQTKADMLVCSQTPTEALTREWEEQGIDKYVSRLPARKWARSRAHRFASEGRYDSAKMLMIGDAPGDMKAARANNALFFPINPGDEDKSWKRLYEEGLDRFFAGEFAGDYEAALIEEFDSYLPELPPWKK